MGATFKFVDVCECECECCFAPNAIVAAKCDSAISVCECM